MINADNLKWIIPSKEHSTISENCIRYGRTFCNYNGNISTSVKKFNGGIWSYRSSRL